MKILIGLFAVFFLFGACNSAETTEEKTQENAEAEMFDCGTDADCMKAKADNCELAKATVTDGEVQTYSEVRGLDGDSCVLYTKYLTHRNAGFVDTELVCNIPKAELANRKELMTIGLYDLCSGSFVDKFKAMMGQ